MATTANARHIPFIRFTCGGIKKSTCSRMNWSFPEPSLKKERIRKPQQHRLAMLLSDTGPLQLTDHQLGLGLQGLAVVELLKDAM